MGVHSVKLIVADYDGASDTQEFFVTVKEVNQPPSFTSTPVTQAEPGETYTYAITTNDPNLPNGDELTISYVSPLPAWLTLTDHGDGTATLAGTPDRSDGGEHAIQLKVTDLEGEMAEQNFTIEVTQFINFIPLFIR